MFPLRWVGGFHRTSRWEEELDVEITSWGTVGAGGVRRVQLRGHGSPFQTLVRGSSLWGPTNLPAFLGGIGDPQPPLPRTQHFVLPMSPPSPEVAVILSALSHRQPPLRPRQMPLTPSRTQTSDLSVSVGQVFSDLASLFLVLGFPHRHLAPTPFKGFSLPAGRVRR